MTIDRWKELNDHLLSIAVSGEEIGEGNGCFRIDEGEYVPEELFKKAFENDEEMHRWIIICNLQTVEGLSIERSIQDVNNMSDEEIVNLDLCLDDEACVYYTEGWK